MKTLTTEFRKWSGIYKITGITGEFYIGSTTSLYNRLSVHKSTLLSGTHKNAHLQRYFDKFGTKFLDYEILEFCDKSELLQREQHYIDTLNPGFNIQRKAVRRNKVLTTNQPRT